MSRYYRYKNGAEVTVRPDLEARTRYYMRSGFREGEAYRDATYSQVDRAGQIVHIHGKRDGKYFITEDGAGKSGQMTCSNRLVNASVSRYCEV